MRPPVYIAGPYRGTPDEVTRNIRRAAALGAYATRCGLTPYVPHLLSDVVFGGDDSLAMDCCVAMVQLVASDEHGQLWVIARDDRSLSAGTQIEVETWDGAEPTIRTWPEWAGRIHMVADAPAHMLADAPAQDDTGFDAAPSRYVATGREAIDVIREELGDEGCRAFCLGNARKYELRAGHKVSTTASNDLEKARWYRAFADFIAGAGPDPRSYRSR